MYMYMYVHCSVLGDSWKCIRDHIQAEALHRSHTISQMEERVIQTLSVFLLSDLEKRFQTVSVKTHASFIFFVVFKVQSYLN